MSSEKCLSPTLSCSRVSRRLGAAHDQVLGETAVGVPAGFGEGLFYLLPGHLRTYLHARKINAPTGRWTKIWSLYCNVLHTSGHCLRKVLQTPEGRAQAFCAFATPLD